MIDPMPEPMVLRPFCIERVRRKTEGTFTIELVPANGAVDTSFAWGQFDKEVFRGESEAHEK